MNGIDGTRGRGTVARRCLRTGGLAAAGTVLMLGVASQPAYAATAAPARAAAVVTCGGLTAAAALAAGFTIHDNSASAVAVIDLGGPGKDWMLGSDFNDILDGQGGRDFICGRDGNDDLRGLGGNDKLSGNGGTDVGDGGIGTNTCTASTETQNNC